MTVRRTPYQLVRFLTWPERREDGCLVEDVFRNQVIEHAVLRVNALIVSGRLMRFRGGLLDQLLTGIGAGFRRIT